MNIYSSSTAYKNDVSMSIVCEYHFLTNQIINMMRSVTSVTTDE